VDFYLKVLVHVVYKFHKKSRKIISDEACTLVYSLQAVLEKAGIYSTKSRKKHLSISEDVHSKFEKGV